MKLTLDDLRVRGRNEQVIAKIKTKFGSLAHYAKVIGLSEKTVNQYLKQNKDFSDNFKQKLVNHLGDYNGLCKDAVQQVEEIVDTLARDIYSYREESDIKVLEEALKMSMDYKLPKSIAKSYRNIGKYYSLRGLYSVSMRFYNLAKISSQQADDIDIECMIIGEIISVHTFLNELRDGERLFRDSEASFEKADPYRKYWYYYYAAVLYITDRSYAYAKAVLTKALANVTNDYVKLTCLSLLGICDKREGNFESALFYYKEALELAEYDRDKAMCCNNIANVYHYMENKELAEQYIERAMSFIKLDSIREHIDIYSAYVEIKGNDESINRLLCILESQSRNLYIPYLLESIVVAINKSSDTERIKRIILKYVEQNTKDKKFVDELYRLLGLLIHKMEVIKNGKH